MADLEGRVLEAFAATTDLAAARRLLASLQVEWERRGTSAAATLDSITARLEAATATLNSADGLQSVIALGELGGVFAVPGGAEFLQLLVELDRQEQGWQALVADLPPGQFYSYTQLTDVYGNTQEEGGWYLVNFAHNSVGVHVALLASSPEAVSSDLRDWTAQWPGLTTPVVVEAPSLGARTTAIASPYLVPETLFISPYMIAEVKSMSSPNRRSAREQLADAETYAAQVGEDWGVEIETIRVGAPDENGEPQLQNPWPSDTDDNDIEFPTEGLIDLYDGQVYVAYRLTEPGIYEYRIYITDPPPQMSDPADVEGRAMDDDGSMLDVIEYDYQVQLNTRPTTERLEGWNEIIAGEAEWE